jgi:hypothetical protein
VARTPAALLVALLLAFIGTLGYNFSVVYYIKHRQQFEALAEPAPQEPSLSTAGLGIR